MKSRLCKVICLTLCLVLAMSVIGFASSVEEEPQLDSTKITEPYDYPVVPGTDEWRALKSHEEMVEACRVPEEILKEMTTEALFETAMTYPLLSDMLFYSDMRQGYEITKENCDIFKELFAKPDVEEVINKYISSGVSTCSADDSLDKKVSKTCFEVIYNVEFEAAKNS